jgi:ABC-2 type transport system ATP-binding protein
MSEGEPQEKASADRSRALQGAALRAEGLRVRYGHHEALKGVDLDFNGPSLGILGPNGAGKSTLIKSILGLVQPSSGSLQVFGLSHPRDELEIRRRIGYVPERDGHFPDLSAVDFVTLGGELAGMPRNDAIQRAHEMLHFCGLGEARYRPVDEYSAGMKQRAKLAQALVHDPELLLLDEPTNGLDPEGRLQLLAILRDLQEHKGIRVLLSSHLLRDVEFVCRDVAVVAGGRIVKCGHIDDLKRISDRHWLVRIRGDVARFENYLGELGARVEKRDRETWWVGLAEDQDPRVIIESAAAFGLQLRGLQREEASLEELFLSSLTGADRADS